MGETEENWQPKASIDTIQKRAQMLQKLRAFFDVRDVLEVETPLLSAFRTTDPHLSSFSTDYQDKQYYLNTSPEYAMKRLLAQYQQPVFQICKSFRVDELGPNHNPEFTLLEWYRPGFSPTQLMDELVLLLNAVSASPVEVQRESYQAIFEQHAGLNPHSASAEQCRNCALEYQIEIPVGLDDDVDEWLDWLLTQLVLPAFKKNQFTIVYDYPKSQCALAKLSKNQNDITVAARFELYFGEIELANGFDELLDADEQEKRFLAENKKRHALNLPVSDIDSNFLAALDYGLPECSGVAVGLDRLLMVLDDKEKLSEVLSFPWQYC